MAVPVLGAADDDAVPSVVLRTRSLGVFRRAAPAEEGRRSDGKAGADRAHGGYVRGDVARIMVQAYAEETLVRATIVLGDVRADEDDREDAARVIQAILLRAHPTERQLAEIITALSRALDVHLAVHRVLGELRQLRPAEVDRVGGGLERMMRQAFRADRGDDLCKLIIAAIDVPEWFRRIRGKWAEAAFRHAVNDLPNSKYPAAFLVSGWISTYGVVPEWMRTVVEERPDVVASTGLPLATRWQLHHAVPSVAAWKALAESRRTKPVLEPAEFANQLDIAVETLTQAIGETSDAATNAVLGRWRHELTGETP